MGKKADNDLEKVMNEAVEAASEMSALLREAESSRKEAEQLIKQLKVGDSPKVKDYLAGKRILNEEEASRMTVIQNTFKEEVGDLEHSRKVVEELNQELEAFNLEELTKQGRRKISI